MIKISAKNILNSQRQPTDRNIGGDLMDLERGKIAYEALTCSILDNDIMDDMTLTTLGNWIYDNIFIPQHELIRQSENIVPNAKDKSLS